MSSDCIWISYEIYEILFMHIVVRSEISEQASYWLSYWPLTSNPSLETHSPLNQSILIVKTFLQCPFNDFRLILLSAALSICEYVKYRSFQSSQQFSLYLRSDTECCVSLASSVKQSLKAKNMSACVPWDPEMSVQPNCRGNPPFIMVGQQEGEEDQEWCCHCEGYVCDPVEKLSAGQNQLRAHYTRERAEPACQKCPRVRSLVPADDIKISRGESVWL